MKFKICPFCKFYVPARSKSCPVCNHVYTKFEYFRMNYIKYIFLVIILLYILYNVAEIIMINAQIRNYLEEGYNDIQEIEKLEKKYDDLNRLQKYFVHGSEIDYIKENINDYSQAEYINGEEITLYFESGSQKGIYTGSSLDNQPVGYGTFVFVNEEGYECVYEGEFSDNAFNGNGTLTKGNGEVYSGTFVNGKLNGEGQYFNENGELIYEGTFVNDYLTGFGTMYTPNGFIMYRGDFMRGIPSENNYREECTDVSAAQLYNDTASYVGTNISLTGVITDVSVLDDATVQYVLSPQNSVGNDDICVKYMGNIIDINIGDVVTMYGYCSDPEDFYTEAGEQKNGIVLMAFYTKFITQ